MKIENEINHAQIVEYASRFLKEAYNMELEIPIVINGRLKSSFGRFIWRKSDKKPLRLEFSKNYIMHHEPIKILGTIKHECIHYALFVKGLPFRDGDDYFEKELIKHGSHSTGTSEYKGKVVVYGCPDCETTYNRRRKYPKNKRYLSHCCKSVIVYLGEKII